MHSGKMFASVQNHKILNLIGIVSIAVAFVTSVIFNALAGSGELNILIIVLIKVILLMGDGIGLVLLI